MSRRLRRRSHFEPAPRPYVVFAATTRLQAVRLYRAQNLVWAWLGLAAILNAVAYFDRPNLGPVIVSGSRPLDLTRMVLFGLGGTLITSGVWTIRRALEVIGHILFTTGAVLNVVASLSLPNSGGVELTELLLSGLAFTSAYRAYFIVRWIGADARVAPGE